MNTLYPTVLSTYLIVILGQIDKVITPILHSIISTSKFLLLVSRNVCCLFSSARHIHTLIKSALMQ